MRGVLVSITLHVIKVLAVKIFQFHGNRDPSKIPLSKALAFNPFRFCFIGVRGLVPKTPCGAPLVTNDYLPSAASVPLSNST
jgi:hypothetical protein